MASRDAEYLTPANTITSVYNLCAVMGLSGWNHAVFPVSHKVLTTYLIHLPTVQLTWKEYIPYGKEWTKKTAAAVQAIHDRYAGDVRREIKSYKKRRI